VSDAPPEAFGPYLVYEQLGIGGMASVYRAEQKGIAGFSRQVALKRMLPHVAANEDMVKSFVREAHLASQLRHTNVAQTFELGKVGDIYFIAMELVTGPNLREILKHCASSIVGCMPVSVALNVLNQICDALDYAHNLCDESGKPLGIIHRDVSPSNVIVAEGGVCKLIDFGIAKVSGKGMQTMAGTIKGKFGYMAPEYIEGQLDARADLFAVGVIAHELLTNRPLFTGPDDMETLQRVRRMEIPPPSSKNPQVPPEVDDIVMTALARDPERRWQHATALRNAMTTVTKRLDLVISNAQVVEWVEWAFEQTNPRAHAAPDEDPRIELDHGEATAVLTTKPSVHQRLAMKHPGRFADPPRDTPVGTPQKITAQQGAAEEVVPTVVRPSQPKLNANVVARERPPSMQQPAVQPAISRTLTPDQPALPRTFTPSNPRIDVRSSQPNINATLAGVPPARAIAHSSKPPPYRDLPPDPTFGLPTTPLGAPIARGSGLGSNETASPSGRAGKGSAFVTVVLVLLAAAVAAVTVYFVLPLLT
jgi:eukaryotic-like serine/threonine-protein kinase